MLIRIKSPTGKEIVVGEIKRDIISGKATAYFFITEARFFREAEGGKGALGFDEELLPKITKCEWVVFRLFDGTAYKVKARDFIDRSWVYPPKDNPEYKANSSVFAPKRVMDQAHLKELHDKNFEEERKRHEIEILKTL